MKVPHLEAVGRAYRTSRVTHAHMKSPSSYL